MPITTTVNAQAALLDHPEGAIPHLLLQDPQQQVTASGSDTVTTFVAAALGAGLHLAPRNSTLSVPAAEGWQVRLSKGLLSVHSPRLSAPFLHPLRLTLPPGWRRAAQKLGCVLIYAGDDLGLVSGTGAGKTGDLMETVSAAVARAGLAVGTAPFRER
ncbi:hypothetical protein ABR738_00135 [Streptomyces sp. Edi4]|uniref:hypothetical protein n=1 Tax=Streptomyces sp. Edi4 TaxID=3162527 RepID=UPI003305E38A